MTFRMNFMKTQYISQNWLQSILLTCGAVVRAPNRRKQRLEHALGSVWIRLETWWRTTGRRKRRRRLLPTPAGVLRKWLVWTEPPCRTSRTSGRNLFEEQPETRGLEIRISITGIIHLNVLLFLTTNSICNTTLQSIMNTKLSKQRFWHCYENRLIKTIQTIPHNL